MTNTLLVECLPYAGSSPTVATDRHLLHRRRERQPRPFLGVADAVSAACRIISRSIGTGCQPIATMFSWCMSTPTKT